MVQLQAQLQLSLGPPLHSCLGRAFVAVYAVGDSLSLHETLGKCCDVIKMKEDAAASPSNNKLYVQYYCCTVLQVEVTYIQLYVHVGLLLSVWELSSGTMEGW